MAKTLKEIFIESAKENINNDGDICGSGWILDRIMDEYGEYFKIRRSKDKEALAVSYALAGVLFGFLSEPLTGSLADYFGTDVGMALYDNGLALTIRPMPEQDRSKIYTIIYGRALSPMSVISQLRNYGFKI